jgi:y4mF family transcriptional regulator
MTRDRHNSDAARMLRSSRTKPGTSASALIRALGSDPRALQSRIPEAQEAQGEQDQGRAACETESSPVNMRAVGQTTNPLKSIAELGTMARGARKAMNMNQTEFAAHAGVGRRFVSELERGKPSLEFDKVLACIEAAGIDLFAKKRRT